MAVQNSRIQFIALVNSVIAELGGEISAEGSNAPKQEMNLALEVSLQEGPKLLFLHSTDPAHDKYAYIEIAIGAPPEGATAIYAALLAMNAASWPAAYGLDGQTGDITYGWPVPLAGALPPDVAWTIQSTVLRLAGLPRQEASQYPEARSGAAHFNAQTLQ